MSKLLGHYKELESKYYASLDQLILFKRIASKISKSFVYIEGPDTYFVKPGTDNFKRYRKATYGDTRAEITTKLKTKSGNNLHRIEKNLRVDNNESSLVISTIEDDGYKYNFTIIKYCHIYFTEDANLVFYTVIDETSDARGRNSEPESFIEIEVKEDILHSMSEEEAMNIIKKYEEAFKDLGINSNKRLKLSLYERYKRE
jgi:hypothetical protein